MFINFTNHQSSKWPQKQLAAAEIYGTVKDFPFPDVNPENDEGYINGLADYYTNEIIKHSPAAVLCQGEMTLAFAVARKLAMHNITVLAACSSREVAEHVSPDGKTVKHVEFNFIRFRKYL